MRVFLIALAVAALVAIGTAEAAISVRQLSELPGRGRPPLAPSGAALTLAALTLSLAVYVVFAHRLARDAISVRRAVASGTLVGALAGAIGGTLRALLVRDYLIETLARYGLAATVSDWALAVYVVGAVCVSAMTGAAISWWVTARRTARSA